MLAQPVTPAPTQRALPLIALQAIGGSTTMPRAPMVDGNTTRLLVDEAEAVPEMLRAIAGARRQIDVAMFCWEPTGAGKQMADAVIAKARQGVQVNVQIDEVGSALLPFTPQARMVQRMRDAGVNVIKTKRVSLSRGVQPVDHRKLLVVDGTTAITGGMNLSKRFAQWHDVAVRVDGPAAAQAAARFLARWKDEGGKITPQQISNLSSGSGAVQGATAGAALLANTPHQDLHATEYLLEGIRTAKQRVWVQTPFLTDPQFAVALTQAARRGVDVRVLVSGPSSWWASRPAVLLTSSHYGDLRDAGAKVYEQPGMAHGKVALIDDTATVGSVNLSRRATTWDHELALASTGGELTRQVETLFGTDTARSRQVDAKRADTGSAGVMERLRKTFGLKY